MQNDKYIVSLIESGGPEPSQYKDLNKWFKSVSLSIGKTITRSDIRNQWSIFQDAFSVDTMQGFVVQKPHGYAGDFEIIDRIYTNWLSPKVHLQKWDKFFHWQAAPKAVRNRKGFFKQLLEDIDRSDSDFPDVLNVGSGPGRDVYEYLNKNPNTKIQIDCLDMDSSAIEYSKKLIGKKQNVEFICRNAFRFKPTKKYDLIWSAGLFDYLDENQFTYLLKSLYGMLESTGRLVIGNFSELNTSREYMEFGEWFLHHRSEADLIRLAEQAGIKPGYISVCKEPSGVNLFLALGN